MTITSKNVRSYSERRIINGFNIFVKSNATDLVDAWFNKNEIWALKFKCKTWNKLKAMATKLNIAAMRAFFKNESCEISFSHYAGCSMCPCSPGYKVRKASAPVFSEYENKSVWADINVDVSSIEAILSKMDSLLALEIEANKNAQ